MNLSHLTHQLGQNEVFDAFNNAVLDGVPIRFEAKNGAHIKSSDQVVSSGVANAVFIGGQSMTESEITAYIDENVSSKIMATVSPINLEILSAPSVIDKATHHLVTVKASFAGSPVAGVAVQGYFSAGRLAPLDAATDDAGEMRFDLEGSVEGTGELYLSLGKTVTETSTIDVLNPSTVKGEFGPVIVGDSGGIGSVSIVNSSGVSLNIPLPVSGTFDGQKLTGGSEDTMVSIGSVYRPNTETFFHETFESEKHSNGNAGFIFSVPEDLTFTKLGNGRRAVELSNSKSINVTPYRAVPDILMPVHTLELSFSNNSDGSLVRMNASAGHSQILSIIGGRLVLQFNEGDRQVEIRSEEIIPDRVYEVAFGLVENEVVLYVNGEKYSTEYLDFQGVQLNASSSYLSVGGFAGNIHSMSGYDHSDDALLAFTDNTTSVMVAVDEPLILQEIVSQNTYGSYVRNGDRDYQFVDVIADTQAIASIGVFNTELYAEVYKSWSDILPNEPNLEMLVDDSASALEHGIFGFSDAMLGKSTHRDEQSSLTRVLALLNHYKYVSKGLNSSEGVDKLIESVISAQNDGFNMPFDDLFGQALAKNRVEDTEGNSTFDSFDLVLTILVELAEADNTVVTEIFKSIDTAEDFHTWLEFISMPTSGWPGLVPPKLRVEDTCDNAPSEIFLGIDIPIQLCRQNGARLGLLVDLIIKELGQEYEANPNLLSKVIVELRDMLITGGPGFQKTLLGFEVSSSDVVSVDPLSILGIQKAEAALPVVVGAAVAIIVKKTIKIAQRLTRGKIGSLKAVLQNRTSLRLDAQQALGVILYIQTRLDKDLCAEIAEISTCVTFKAAAGASELGDINARIDLLLGNVLFGVINPKYITVSGKVEDVKNETRCYIRGTTNGAMFELALIAFYHALYEFDDGRPIIGLDVPTNVFLTDKQPNGKWKILKRLQRKPDIVLKGKDVRFPENWIEAKSVQAYPSNASGKRDAKLPGSSLDEWSQWNLNSEGNVYHKQFYLDWVANTKASAKKVTDIKLPATASVSRPINKLQYASDYQWLLHDWNSPKREVFPVKIKGKTTDFIKARGFPFGEDIDKLRVEMVKLPVREADKSHLESVELSSSSDYDKVERGLRGQRIKNFNLFAEITKNKKISTEFEVPEDIKKWVERFEDIDLEKWVGWLDYIPEVPDFGLSEKIEERVDELLSAVEQVDLCELP